MGLSGMSLGSLILIFLVVLVVFGTKRLRNVGEDVGAAIKSFRKGVKETETDGGDADKAKPVDE